MAYASLETVLYLEPEQHDVFADALKANGAVQTGNGLANKEEALIKALSSSRAIRNSRRCRGNPADPLRSASCPPQADSHERPTFLHTVRGPCVSNRVLYRLGAWRATEMPA